jgi:hypothetical protein
MLPASPLDDSLFARQAIDFAGASAKGLDLGALIHG